MTRKPSRGCRRWLPLLLFCTLLSGCGQLKRYTSANAHSHNDYEQPEPLELASRAGFGSVEADIFLRGDSLFVAHDRVDIAAGRTLDALYLKPLSGLPAGREIQLLIDFKTGADSTLPVLIRQLRKYPALAGDGEPAGGARTGNVKIVISGNRPVPEQWPEAPAFVYFDGRPAESYGASALEKVGLISDNFGNYSRWEGSGPIPKSEKRTLLRVVRSAHKLGKPFRFWGVPDTPEAWRLMTRLGVDYINTDRIDALADWLQSN